MSDDQNLTQNPISEENPTPPSPQEPMADMPVPTTDPVSAETPLEAPESPKNADIPVSLNNDNPENEPISTPAPEEAIPAEPTEIPANHASNGTSKPSVEPVSETRTAQIPVNEPLPPEPEPISVSQPQPTPAPVFVEPQQDKVSLARSLLIKARNTIQFLKRKKLDKIMTLFLKKSKISNDEVEKFLHVSDATATRYLSQLEKENRIKQVGKTGKGVSYSRI